MNAVIANGTFGAQAAVRRGTGYGHFLPFADALRETSNCRLHPSNRPFDWRKGTLLHRPIWPQCTHGRRRVHYGFLTDRASTQMIKLTDERRSSSTISRCVTSRRREDRQPTDGNGGARAKSRVQDANRGRADTLAEP